MATLLKIESTTTSLLKDLPDGSDTKRAVLLLSETTSTKCVSYIIYETGGFFFGQQLVPEGSEIIPPIPLPILTSFPTTHYTLLGRGLYIIALSATTKQYYNIISAITGQQLYSVVYKCAIIKDALSRHHILTQHNVGILLHRWTNPLTHMKAVTTDTTSVVLPLHVKNTCMTLENDMAVIIDNATHDVYIVPYLSISCTAVVAICISSTHFTDKGIFQAYMHTQNFLFQQHILGRVGNRMMGKILPEGLQVLKYYARFRDRPAKERKPTRDEMESIIINAQDGTLLAVTQSGTILQMNLERVKRNKFTFSSTHWKNIYQMHKGVSVRIENVLWISSHIVEKGGVLCTKSYVNKKGRLVDCMTLVHHNSALKCMVESVANISVRGELTYCAVGDKIVYSDEFNIPKILSFE